MNQLYINCQELQRFLERQWQKIRGIISQEAAEISSHERRPLQQDGRTSQGEISSEHSGDNAELGPESSRGRRSGLWTGSMDVTIEQCTVVDIVSIIDTTCETLTRLLDAGYGYRRYYVLLLEALLKLLTCLKDVERQHPEALKRSGIFSQLKVSVSITYALVEKVSARQQLSIFLLKFKRLPCVTADAVQANFKNQITETKTLLKEVQKTSELYDQAKNPMQVTAYSAESSHSQPIYGINKLTVAACHQRSVILNGDKVTFLIRDSENNVVYTVQTWLNNPDSLFQRAKRLSASVECSSGKMFNIGVPGYPNKEADLQNRTALIVSGFEQAQVRSFLPGAANKRNMGSGKRKAEALLQEDQPSSTDQNSSRYRKKCAGELLVHSNPKYQKYRGEIVMSNMVLKLDCIGQPVELRKLSLEGKKHKTKVLYKCCVELTGEVLAIYRQKRRNKEEGVFHTLGIGNHPELRDLIICSFVAMGLNSNL
ncbi:unnamed protein product [Calypogeia fissa]